MTVEKALITAIEYEERVRNVYSDAAEKIQSPRGRSILKTLAREEDNHVNYLKHRLQEWRETGKITSPELTSLVPSKDWIDSEILKLKDRLDKSSPNVVDQESEILILEKALDVETDTKNFYESMIGELQAEAREMFSRFLDIERGHMAIVKAELDSVSGNGFWFDFPEFNLEIHG